MKKLYKPSKNIIMEYNEVVKRYGYFKGAQKKIYEYIKDNNIIYMDEVGVIYNKDA